MSQEQEQAGLPGVGGGVQQRHVLVSRHPLLISLLFLCGAALLCIASCFSDSLFPLLALFGVSSMPLCLSLAFVLGLSGILICIIRMIEYFDRRYLGIALCPKSKEHSYASN